MNGFCWNFVHLFRARKVRRSLLGVKVRWPLLLTPVMHFSVEWQYFFYYYSPDGSTTISAEVSPVWVLLVNVMMRRVGRGDHRWTLSNSWRWWTPWSGRARSDRYTSTCSCRRPPTTNWRCLTSTSQPSHVSNNNRSHVLIWLLLVSV